MKNDFVKQLIGFNACNDAVAWVAGLDPFFLCRFFRQRAPMSAQEAWDQCERPDWMLWLDARVDILTDQNRRLFAADCAEHVLDIYESKYPGDYRPRKTIEAIRKFAMGEIGDAAYAAYAAAAAVRAAADAAAYAAHAAYADAYIAEQIWQADRLRKYTPKIEATGR